MTTTSLRVDQPTAAIVLTRQCLAHGWTLTALMNDLRRYDIDADRAQAGRLLSAVAAWDEITGYMADAPDGPGQDAYAEYDKREAAVRDLITAILEAQL